MNSALRSGVIRAPREILFGAGTAASTGRFAARAGARALLCTDPQLACSDGFEVVRTSLSESGLDVHVFDGGVPELPTETIDACVEAARGHSADVVVAFGGGSSIDLAKVTALLLQYGGTIDTYYGESQVPGPAIPIVAVPTTAGTGSEVTPVAVVTDPSRELKVGISSPYLIPMYAVCDPVLSLGCPRGVTAHAGIDALAHAVEAFTAVARDGLEPQLDRVFVGKNVLSDTFALEAIRRIGSSLVRAVEDGADLDARSEMLLGSLLAGLAFGVAGTAVAHALQYPIGSLTNTPHGLGIGVLLPYAMAYNLPERTGELTKVAAALGGAPGAGPEEAVALIETIRDAIGIPASLADIGIEEDDVPRIAESAATIRRLVDNNPRFLDVSALEVITRAAWAGDRALLATSAA